MRLPLNSLRISILAELTFLIVAAMLLINVVMVKFAERDLVEAKTEAGRSLIHALGTHLGLFFSPKGERFESALDTRFSKSAEGLIAGSGFSDVLIVDSEGKVVFSTGLFRDADKETLAPTLNAVRTGAWSSEFAGTTWGVLWLEHREVRISAPLLLEGRMLGGIQVRASLVPLYKGLRRSQKIIFMYIFMDAVILVLVGGYLISRIVTRPIKRLLKMSSEYTEGSFIPALEESNGNEIGELSRSLTHMLKRLDQNKIELKNHVQSLERANRELQQAQDEIIRSEKFASVGRLAAGIAHEIGNPVGIVLGYLEMLNKTAVTEEEQRDFLVRIEGEISRVNAIIRQLLDFSRPSEGKREPVGVQEIIMKTLEILRPQPMMEGVALALEFDAAFDTVNADPGQLQQVFLNIIMNAADALSEKENSTDGEVEKTLFIGSRNSEQGLELRFRDNGPGIEENERVRIFDPFYTTKEPGKGTGLGLSVSCRIVENLGGRMGVESNPGEGATITLTLPLYDGR